MGRVTENTPLLKPRQTFLSQILKIISMKSKSQPSPRNQNRNQIKIRMKTENTTLYGSFPPPHMTINFMV